MPWTLKPDFPFYYEEPPKTDWTKPAGLVPKAPRWIDKVNYVVSFMADPCHAPLLVYLELARKPLGDAIIIWFSFDVFDIFRGYFRPTKALRGNPTARRGKRPRPVNWKKRVGRAIPVLAGDWGSWIGKHLPGAEKQAARKVSQGAKTLWIIDGFFQRLFFWWLVIDLLTDTLYAWCTLVDMSEYCTRQREGTLYGTGPGGGASSIFPWFTVAPDTILWQEGPVQWVGIGATYGEADYTAVSAISTKANAVFGCTYEQRLQIDDAHGSRTVYSGPVEGGPGETIQCVVSAVMVGPGTVRVEHKAHAGSCVGEKQDFWLYGGKKRVLPEP